MRKIKTAALIIAAAVFALMLSACGGAEVSVKINDNGTASTVSGKDDMTVSQLIEKAEIKLGSKDEVTPSKELKWKEANASEITIKRYAKVNVVNGSEKKTVELVGGTVEKAIEKAGFKLSDGLEADADLKSYLKDGMTITLKKAVSVKLTSDGKTKDYPTKAKTVKEFLDEQKIKLGKDDEVSPKPDSEIKDGLKIVVKRVEYKEEKRTEKIKYETETTTDSSLPEGETKVVQEGKEGKKEITYRVKYVDGKEDGKKKLSEKTTEEPVNEIIAEGTKQATEQNNAPQQSQASEVQQSRAPQQSEQSQPAGKTIVSKQKIYDCDGSGHGYYLITYSDGSEEHEDF